MERFVQIVTIFDLSSDQSMSNFDIKLINAYQLIKNTPERYACYLPSCHRFWQP